MFKAAIFDIDGTLILTDHAGIRALAFTLSIHDNSMPHDRLPFDYSPHGKTDPLIFRELFQRIYQREPTNEEHESLKTTYLNRLPHEMRNSEKGYRIMPGVLNLLAALKESGCELGLGTGNFSEGARIKLEPGDLNRWFRFGGYGDDSENRAEMIRAAIRRGRELIGRLDPEECVVLGDTTRDIDAAREAGAAVIGVATGMHSVEELATADLAVPTLASPEVYRFIGLPSASDQKKLSQGACVNAA